MNASTIITTPCTGTTLKRVASHCCICSRTLTDAKSIELGIGPVCRQRYMGMEIQTTPIQFKQAMGLLLLSKSLPKDFKTECKSMRHLADGARQIANALVYMASANYQIRDFVMECANVLRCLNYVDLASRLEEDRSDAFIRKADEAGWFLYFPSKWDFHLKSLLSKVPGCHRTQDGKKEGRKIPDNQRDYVDAILGTKYPNGYLNDQGVIFPIQPVSPQVLHQFQTDRQPAWMKKRIANSAVRNPSWSPSSLKNIYVEEKNGRYGVKTPFNRAFVDDIKKIQGKKPCFDANNKFFCWAVPISAKDKVDALLEKHFPGVLPVIGLPSY